MKRFSCYSLLELLTVVVIASILLAIAVPAVSSMMKGNAATQAGRELMGRIKAAKAYAVSSQTPVAIVFYRTEKPSGATLSSNYACSAYRICTVKYISPNGQNNMWQGWVFQNWVSEWYFLPKGIAIGLPETIPATLPGELSEVGSGNAETDNSLIRCIGDDNGTDSTLPNFFEVGAAGSGVSPVYQCDLSDIPDHSGTVTFRNAIVFNAKGLMEKPKNLSRQDDETSLQPDKAVIIPLRTAYIEGNTVTEEGKDGTKNQYIPVRIDPSGKTYFYDGYVEY